MTYPPSSSGYPPSQQPTTQFSAPTQQFGKHDQPAAQSPAATAAVPSKLPFILLAAIGVLGLLVYLFSFGPQFKIESTDFPQLGSATGTSLTPASGHATGPRAVVMMWIIRPSIHSRPSASKCPTSPLR